MLLVLRFVYALVTDQYVARISNERIFLLERGMFDPTDRIRGHGLLLEGKKKKTKDLKKR